jgi:hypothetical protein
MAEEDEISVERKRAVEEHEKRIFIIGLGLVDFLCGLIDPLSDCTYFTSLYHFCEMDQ